MVKRIFINKKNSYWEFEVKEFQANGYYINYENDNEVAMVKEIKVEEA